MNILNKQQIEDMKLCGTILKEALKKVVAQVKVGISTYDLDQLAEKEIVKNGGKPSFKNYFVAGVGSYPSSLCVSINDEVVHGIPSKNRIIVEGDVVSLDLGAEYHGVYTDMATTVIVGESSAIVQDLVRTTKECLENGIQAVEVGGHIGDIGYIVEKTAKAKGFGVIRDFVGHGIGDKPHLPPKIPNYGKQGSLEEIKEGMALAIEPMITLGGENTYSLADGWTAKTDDGSISAHFEHTIVIENGKVVVVTE